MAAADPCCSEARSLLRSCDGEAGEAEDSAGAGLWDPPSPPARHEQPSGPCRAIQVATISLALLATAATASVAARQHGLHPTRAASGGVVGVQLRESRCHTATPGEECYQNIAWHHMDIADHPQWYAGLTQNSSLYEWQMWAHEQGKKTCSRPCPPEEDSAGSHPVRPGRGAAAGGASSWSSKVHKSDKNRSNKSKLGQEPVRLKAKRGKRHEKPRKAAPAGSKKNKKPPATTTELPGEPEEDDCAEIKQWKGGCHTSMPGESCFSSVNWALKVGLPSHPEWYKGIGADATFEEVQGFLHGHHFQLSCCPLPCESGAVSTSAAETATEDASEVLILGDGDGGEPAGCLPVAEGDSCHEAVDWAMKVGILQHPEWYESKGGRLTGDSTFEEFQQFLHDERHMCPAPCRSKGRGGSSGPRGAAHGSSASSTTTTRSPSTSSGRSGSGAGSGSTSTTSSRTRGGCKTPVKGDDCYEGVVWAMKHGVKAHADWYPGLGSQSSFEEFQKLLHEKYPAMSRCPPPCPSSAVEALSRGSADFSAATPRSIQDSQVVAGAGPPRHANKSAQANATLHKSNSSSYTTSSTNETVANGSSLTNKTAASARKAKRAEAAKDVEAVKLESEYEDDMYPTAAAAAASKGGDRNEVQPGGAGIMAAV